MARDLIDPNTVRLVGENSILRLQDAPGGVNRTLCSFWRILHSPAGNGHCLFMQSDALDDRVHIFSDSRDLARWMQHLEVLMRPDFADSATTVQPGTFARLQPDPLTYRETVSTAERDVVLEWRDLSDPFMTVLEPGNRFVGRWSVYSCLVPAAQASLRIGTVQAGGRAFPDVLEGQPMSTSFLALGEIWLAPAEEEAHG